MTSIRTNFVRVVVLALPCTLAAQATQFVATSPAAMTWFSALGGAIDDFDRNGAADLLVTPLIVNPYTLLRNDGLGGLAVNPLPFVNTTNGICAVFVDHDGDGDRDLFLSWPGPFGQSTALFRCMGGTSWVAVPNMPAMVS